LAEIEKSAVTAGSTTTVTEAVWLSAPEVATNCTVDVLAAADDDAARATCWGVPGMRVKLDGVAVTPAGRPLTKTVIVPENPLRAVAERLTGCWLPAVTLRLERLAEIEKSAVTAGSTTTVTEAVWLMVPEVAMNCTVDVLAAADAAAERLTCWGAP
jgi:hypothetical protein